MKRGRVEIEGGKCPLNQREFRTKQLGRAMEWQDNFMPSF
jgi:hypothetical protein